MIAVLPKGGVLLVFDRMPKRAPQRPVRHRVPSAESDFLRGLIASVPDEDRRSVKRLLCRLFQLTPLQLAGIQAWSNGKLRGRRRQSSTLFV